MVEEQEENPSLYYCYNCSKEFEGYELTNALCEDCRKEE